MKRTRIVCLLLLVLTLAVMGINAFAASLPDGVVRGAGVVMLLALAGTAYSTVKGTIEK